MFAEDGVCQGRATEQHPDAAAGGGTGWTGAGGVRRRRQVDRQADGGQQTRAQRVLHGLGAGGLGPGLAVGGGGEATEGGAVAAVARIAHDQHVGVHGGRRVFITYRPSPLKLH